MVLMCKYMLKCPGLQMRDVKYRVERDVKWASEHLAMVKERGDVTNGEIVMFYEAELDNDRREFG